MKLVRTWLTMRKPVVTVQQGKLEGAELKSALGLSYLAFRGIPFAAPPVGDLRFKAINRRFINHVLINQDPQPPLPWTGIKDISKEQKYIAPQKEELAPFNIIGDEDCLYLNVYTNSLNQSKPVMFWIHGGAFLVGNSSFCESRPDYLLAKDVVVVSANHRLGAFARIGLVHTKKKKKRKKEIKIRKKTFSSSGFLNLGHRVAPGNFAVKDIIAALEWVKENIANFGGDPDNVTIFGASAGGALVHSLLISPRARDKSEKTMAEINRYLYTHVNNLRSSMKLEDAEVEKLFEMIKDQYFDGKPVTEETLLNFSKLFSLIYFGIPALTLLKDRVKRTTAPNYICVFSYVGNEKTSTDRLVKRQISGASHVDEIAYLLYLPKCKIENPDPPAIGTKDRITLERITRMWTNFAKTGDPTSVKDEYVNVTWKPATSKELCQLKIGDELQLLPLPQDILFP
ncbi:hypothetical protein E2986_03302 [Frieseomelitta varia]|uniref:Carboxylic ester hydrolase n=1 Tax=Frieseomelitta varia TaxID=561572 RepID=A0A833W2D4_9HYME|nr:hypothetical protein E2986_03302 [Frieseomelitta varia]